MTEIELAEYEDYRILRPTQEEDPKRYALRLQAHGHDEIYIRKALRYHFAMAIDAFSSFFEDFEPARLRSIAHVVAARSSRDDHYLSRCVSRGLGISMERAAQHVAKVKAMKTC